MDTTQPSYKIDANWIQNGMTDLVNSHPKEKLSEAQVHFIVLTIQKKALELFKKLDKNIYSYDPSEEATPHKIDDGLFLGNLADARTVPLLKKCNITHVLNMTEWDDDKGTCLRCSKMINIGHLFYGKHYQELKKYMGIEAWDVENYPMFKHFEETYEFIETAISNGHNVLVHCFAGVSRSSTVVAYYLMKKKKWGAHKALHHMQQKRRVVCPNPGFLMQLLLHDEHSQEESQQSKSE
jgi:hypothetical protein